MRTFTGVRRLGVMAVLAVAAACSGPMYRAPEITLQNVQIGGLGLRGGTLLVNVEVQNPNRFALNSNQIEYELSLRDPGEPNDTTWIPFAEGIYDQPFSVGAGETATIQVPVEFTYAGAGGVANALIRSGTFTYRATGRVDVRTPIGGYVVPFQRRGTVALMGSP